MTKRILIFLYGVAAYAMFLGVFAYAIGFIGGIVTPTSLDGEPDAPLAVAMAINLVLLAVFALQHSIMARPVFKKALTKVVPEEAERSTYVVATNIALITMFLFWEPMGGTIWNIENPIGAVIMYALYALGWLTVLVSTFLINHFDLFGLRQVTMALMGKPYTHLKFGTPGPYKHLRHPLYVGWFMVFWFTPHMTTAHLVFAVMTTVYILIAIRFEERDLIAAHGQDYANYRKATPMFIPRFGRKKIATEMQREPIAM